MQWFNTEMSDWTHFSSLWGSLEDSSTFYISNIHSLKSDNKKSNWYRVWPCWLFYFVQTQNFQKACNLRSSSVFLVLDNFTFTLYIYKWQMFVFLFTVVVRNDNILITNRYITWISSSLLISLTNFWAFPFPSATGFASVIILPFSHLDIHCNKKNENFI